MKIQITFLIFTAFIIWGCSASDETASIKSTKWELDSLTAITIPPVTKKSTVEFSSSGQLSGNGGCNSFGGRYKSSAGKLTTSDITATEMACENMQVESNFISALMKNDTYKVKGSKLYLYSNGVLTAILVKAY
jgi:heat shock protein HslJ